MHWSSSVLVCLLLHVWIISTCRADVDSGCPSWGCLPWGSFSLSAGIPSVNSTVAWRVKLETVSSSSDDLRVPRGCVSDQQTVVCTTPSGYISIDPTNGKTLWSYTTKSTPYLPIMDIYGDVIGMDSKSLYYVGADGKPKQPIGVAVLKPMYSLMIGNDSIMLVTGSTNKTAQIVTYLTNGIVDASLPLRGSIQRMNGTFIPCSQPIIAGSRAYLMTYFLPDQLGSKEADRVTGMLRLYAVDMLHQMMPRLVIAWYFNFGRWDSNHISHNPFRYDRYNYHHLKQNEVVLDPIVTYFGGNVYINVPGNLDVLAGDDNKEKEQQPYPGSLWAVRDDGDGGSLLFRKSCFYGPMAVYDTFDKPLIKNGNGEIKTKIESDEEKEHLLWIMNRSPAMIQGVNAHNGTVKDINGFDSIFEKLNGWITSSLSITRSQKSPGNDQLVLGTSDASGQATISVVEISGSQASLVLSRVVSITSSSQSIVEGQIVNVAFYPPGKGRASGDRNKDTWKLGLAAVVKEVNSTSISRTVVGLL